MNITLTSEEIKSFNFNECMEDTWMCNNNPVNLPYIETRYVVGTKLELDRNSLAFNLLCAVVANSANKDHIDFILNRVFEVADKFIERANKHD